ncbi:hypothetical protein KY290_008331 [Solanum tuberosum]|uniref:Uncharacterized protein n=1 Tax=Solanum tuberosum TaxID=4113 RepID=A0ABQ7W864_SOLTU|nr:hypothetical protein KY289_008720 [Solanum tuberosum]KAH0776920.1 hypothetical protein KY290_008331 [Solanum tuberosum]
MRRNDEHTPGMKAQIIQLEHAPARDGHANCTGGAPGKTGSAGKVTPPPPMVAVTQNDQFKEWSISLS